MIATRPAELLCRNRQAGQFVCVCWPRQWPREPYRGLSDEERYRKQAEDCRQMAAKVVSPLDKEAWLKSAVDWLRLADDADLPEKPRWALVALRLA